MDTLRQLLDALEVSLAANEPDGRAVASHVRSILEFLNVPENDTDENCRSVDQFIGLRVLENARLERQLAKLPGGLLAIIEDMGTCLHDAHTARPIAQNFGSTPEQLLSRLGAMSG